MKEENNNIILGRKEEEMILNTVDAHTKSADVSVPSNDTHEYDQVLALLTSAKSSIKPDAALLRKTITKISVPVAREAGRMAAQQQAVTSPYSGTFSRFFSQHTLRFAAPVMVLLIAVAAMIGAAPKKTIAPTITLGEAELAPLAMRTSAVPSTFSEGDATPPADTQPMMMAKMSQTTVPSTTPQNVGELIALLSNEADGDVSLGMSDDSDPLYLVDPTSIDTFQKTYDIQTI